MAEILPVARGAEVPKSEEYPPLIRNEMERVESDLTDAINMQLKPIVSSVIRYARDEYERLVSLVNKSKKVEKANTQDILNEELFMLEVGSMKEVYDQADKINRANIRKGLRSYGMGTDELNTIMGASFGMDLSNMVIASTLRERRVFLARVLKETTVERANEIIDSSIKAGTPYETMANKLRDQLGFTKQRARLIARTEANWYLNDFQRQQVKAAGFNRYKIALAPNACDTCRAVARSQDRMSDASWSVDTIDVLPIHPNCRCVLIPDVTLAWVEEQRKKVSSMQQLQRSKELSEEKQLLEKSRHDSIIEREEATEDLIRRLIKSAEASKEDPRSPAVIVKPEIVIEGVQGQPGEPGQAGKTPVKGVDYMTKDEVDQVIKSVTQKVIQSLPATKDGKTPEKGQDYFTSDEIAEFKDSVTRELIPVLTDTLEVTVDREELKDMVAEIMEDMPKPMQEIILGGMPGTRGLKDLNDTEITSPTNSQVLTYEDGKWVNKAGGGGGSVTASDVTVDNTNLKVVTDTNLQDYIDNSDTVRLNTLTTGFRFGGQLSINSGDNTKFDITASAGQILDNTNPANPTYISFSTTAQTALSVTDITAGITYVYIDSNGTIQQQTTKPTRSEYRTKAILGRLISNGTNLIAATEDITPVQQDANQIRDLAEFIGSIKAGLEISANANLTFARTAGQFFNFGSNFETDATDPHVRTQTSVNPATFLLYKQDGLISEVNTNVPVTQYDNSGTLTTMTNNRFVNHRVYGFQNSDIVIQYGQQEYLSLTAALEALPTESFTRATQLVNGLLLGVITVQKNTTDLTNTTTARITLTNKFGGFGGAAAPSAAGTYLEVGNNLSDLQSATDARSNLGLVTTTTDNAIVRFNGTTGETQSSGLQISDTDELDMNGNNIIDTGDITFKTGGTGGTLRTGTSNADKFVLQAYDTNGMAYVDILELDAGNSPVMQAFIDYWQFEDVADNTKIAKFDASGITTATTRTFTFPDKSGTLALLSDISGGGGVSNLAVVNDDFTENSNMYQETTSGTGSISYVSRMRRYNCGGSGNLARREGSFAQYSGINLFDYNPSLSFLGKFTAGSATSCGFVTASTAASPAGDGTSTANHFGFITVTTGAGTIYYASSGDGTTQQLTDITSSVVTNRVQHYYAQLASGTDVKFYINSTLVATHSTNIPSGATKADAFYGLGARSSNGANFILDIRDLSITWSY